MSASLAFYPVELLKLAWPFDQPEMIDFAIPLVNLFPLVWLFNHLNHLNWFNYFNYGKQFIYILPFLQIINLS